MPAPSTRCGDRARREDPLVREHRRLVSRRGVGRVLLRRPAGSQASDRRAREALETWARSGDVIMVPAYRPGDDRAGIFFELDYYANSRRGAVPEWKNEMAEMSWLFWLTFDGVRSAGEVSVPTLMVHSDGSVFPEHAKAVHAALRGPKQMEWTVGEPNRFLRSGDPGNQGRRTHGIAFSSHAWRRFEGTRLKQHRLHDR